MNFNVIIGYKDGTLKETEVTWPHLESYDRCLEKFVTECSIEDNDCLRNAVSVMIVEEDDPEVETG